MESGVEQVGKVTHFYPKISVAVVELTAPLKVGDNILIKGSTTSLEQAVESMEIEHKAVASAGPGQSIGLKVTGRVRESDLVYKRASPT